MNNRHQQIINYLKTYGSITNSEARAITGAHRNTISQDFKNLLSQGTLFTEGAKKSTRYRLVSSTLFPPEQVRQYRNLSQIKKYFESKRKQKIFFIQTHESAMDENFSFTPDIEASISKILRHIKQKRKELAPEERKRRKERLTIDLAWASSSIEGSTYSLLETEALIKYNQTAQGKQLEEAKMILNHKQALSFIMEIKKMPLSKQMVFELHQILMDGLEGNSGIREGMVRISNSQYVPCDNRFQIEEYFQKIIQNINATSSILGKSIKANLLFAYLQPFVDGNKRTSRMLGNMILVQEGLLPISFSHTPKEEYLKSIILFYEKQNSDYFKYHFLRELEFSFQEYMT